jgi:glycosyltransferase involved in cell wall biosynthesis
MVASDKRIKLFTWHVHGSYLFYLSQGNFDIYIPLDENRGAGYIGRGGTFPFGSNVIEVPIAEIKSFSFDCILFQLPQHYLKDQYEIFSESQRQLPQFYLEHDPPQQVPTDTQHVVYNSDLTLVHVTHFNKLMWNSGSTNTVVIDHGISGFSARYTGELERGIVVINNLDERGRRLGYDVFQEVRKSVPLDLIGMGSEKIGGLGEILHPQLPEFISRYRFFFNPIRYTSLGLAVLEAMTVGIPVVGLATTEMVTVITDGKNGVLHTNIDYLIEKMNMLLADRELAGKLGEEGRRTVLDRFNINRFTDDWYQLLAKVIKQKVKKAA